MEKVLIAVDGTKNSRAAITTFHNSVQHPEEVIILHVQRLEGNSLMTDMLGEAERSTLKESIADTEHKKAMDRRARRILDFYKGELEGSGPFRVKTVSRTGIPAEEILNVAEKEGVELIILGASGKKGLNRMISGSVGRDVRKNAKVPVLVAKKVNICEEPYSWRDATTAITVTTAVIFGLFMLGLFLRYVSFTSALGGGHLN